MFIISKIPKLSYWSKKSEQVIGRKALEPIDTDGCEEGNHNCYFLSSNNEYRFISDVTLKEVD